MKLDDWDSKEDKDEINKDFLEKKFEEINRDVKREEMKELLGEEIQCGVESEESLNVLNDIRDSGVKVSPRVKFKSSEVPVHFFKAIEYFLTNINGLETCKPKLEFYSDYEEESASKYKIELQFEEERFRERHEYRERLNESLKIHGVQDMRRDVFLRVKLADED